jgi:hypothetical protein
MSSLGQAPEPPWCPREAELQAQLDQATLGLSIAPLNHPLKADLFESTLVGFLAVLGVDPARQSFQDPYSYTSSLSGLVKMAQMLVALRAVREAKAGEVGHPADALDKMCERFLIYGVRLHPPNQLSAIYLTDLNKLTSTIGQKSVHTLKYIVHPPTSNIDNSTTTTN